MASLNNKHDISFPAHVKFSVQLFSVSACLSWGESTECKGSQVFLAKTPTSFRRPYVWSARIVLQEHLRRVMIFAKLKPLVSYMIMAKLMLLQCRIKPCLFMEKCKIVKMQICVNIYISIYIYNVYMYIVASRQGVDHRRPGNAALTTKHLHLRLMSGTPLALDGRSLKWRGNTHWESWTEAPWETELTRVFYPLTETDWNPG